MSEIRKIEINKFSTIDWPGKLSAVLFVSGCRNKCPYCHNTELRDFDYQMEGQIAATWQLLETRQDILDAVVISGGEPLDEKNLLLTSCLLHMARRFGYETAIHTSAPYNSKNLDLDLVNKLFIDLKGPKNFYDKYMTSSLEDVEFLIKRAKNLKKEVEIRTTIWSGLFKDERETLAFFLSPLVQELARISDGYYIQKTKQREAKRLFEFLKKAKIPRLRFRD